MGARILSFLLGVMLSGIGWAIVDPKGPAGARLGSLDLGMFEGHRAFIGWGVRALRIVSRWRLRWRSFPATSAPR
eukprot:gene4138-biopygen3400